MAHERESASDYLRKNAVKEALADGVVQNGLLVFLGSTHVVEMAGYAGFDYVVLDLEHTSHDHLTIENQIRAAETAGTTPFVRLPGHSAASATKVLDMGARGLVIPNFTFDDASYEIADMASYPPHGTRGFCPAVRAVAYGADGSVEDNCNFENENVVVVALVEDVRIVDELDQFLSEPRAKKSIDIIMTGTGDLSRTMNRDPGDLKVMEKILQMGEACERNGITWGVGDMNPTRFNTYVEAGARMMLPALDLQLFQKTLIDTVKNLGR